MLRYALRNALVHKGQFVLSVAAIALGVVAGTFVLTDTWHDRPWPEEVTLGRIVALPGAT